MRNTIEDEVLERFGLVPNFFRIAQQDSVMAARLWRFAQFAYLDNPLPSLFKERLFVWLSRFCKIRYCIGRHIGFVVGLGRVAGDPACPPQSVEEVVRLLKRPVPRGEALRPHHAALEQPLSELPAPGSELEWSIFACATELFCLPAGEPDSLRALVRALGPARLEYLQELLAFVQVAHNWTRLHPELAFEDDIEHLLATHQDLSAAVLEDPEAWCSEPGQRLVEELALLRQEKQQLMHASGRRLQQDLADSRLLHEISNELISEQRIDTLYTKLIMAAARLMRGCGGSIQVLVPGQDGAPELDLLASCGLAPEAMRFWQRVRTGSESSCGEALAHGHRVVVPDVARCEFMMGTDDLTMYLKSGIHAVQTTPLRSRDGSMVGCISTYWTEPYQPAEHELQMFDILARQAADLIERAKVEEALRVSEERCRRALQPQNVGVVFFDDEGCVTEANETFLRMSAHEREDLDAGRLRLDEMAPPEWQADARRAMEQLRSQGYTTPYEKEYLRKDGSRWWGLFAATRLSEHEGVAFVIDITGRKLAEQALKEADQRKDVFLATLAHELRNPLAPISNVVHLLRCADGRRRADKLMEMMERQVHQIVRLVDDLLEVSRIAGGKMKLDKEPVAVADIVHDAVETSAPLVEQGRHHLQVMLPTEPVTVQGDRMRLAQVLANLLNNAARYTPEGGHIWLDVARDACDVAISVRDDGIGIPPEQLPHIFDLFAQVQDAARDPGGLGIGLTMARSLVEMHGGTVSAYSAGSGTGSQFTVRLPLPPGADALAGEGNAQTARMPLAGQRILVVDDNRDAADTLRLLLEVEGADVRVAYDGKSALATLATFEAQSILLDLGMAEMDGYEVARQIRQDPRLHGVRIAALTGWGQDADRRQTRACGFDVHLTKPVDLEVLKRWLCGA
ncbi:MAG: ATP-binding protein [Telluria sp.]